MSSYGPRSPGHIKQVVKAGRDYGVAVMGDNLGADDKPACFANDAGLRCRLHRASYWLRRTPRSRRNRSLMRPRDATVLRPLDELEAVVKAVTIPVQAVGGLSIEQAISMPRHGAPLVVIGAPLAVDADSFKTAGGNLEEILRQIVTRIRTEN